VHYLEDRYRGSVWEEIILGAASDVTLVCLSATVSNAEELAAWMRGVRGEVTAVIEDHRPIELRHLYLMAQDDAVRILPTFVDGRPNPEAVRLDEALRKRIERRVARGFRADGPGPSARPRRADVVERLAAADLLPGIFFVFSRQGCEDSVRQCLDAGVRLTTAEEQRTIREIADAHVESVSPADLKVLRYDRFVGGLEAGIASHHAGLVPQFRETVEDLFVRALTKVVFATETLALGINMPARSVVIESLSKFGGDGHQDVTPGEYTQLTGRAGRRGIDEVGYAAVTWSPFHSFAETAALAAARSRALRSSFRPTYNMAVNLVHRYDRASAYRLVASSFAQFQSERPLARQLDAVLELLEARGYIADWQLTDAGGRLAGIYHDCDLLVAEAIGEGLLDGLDAPSLAGVVSMFTYEARRTAPRAALPTPRLARRADALDALSAALRADERAAGLDPTRRPDPGFFAFAHAWADGAELARLLAPRRPQHRRPTRGAPPRAAEISGGDFVRNMRQVVDLLRQIGTVAAGERLGETARRAAEALVRGIVAAATPLRTVEEDDEIAAAAEVHDVEGIVS
jgi:superfamily II RNA helicase